MRRRAYVPERGDIVWLEFNPQSGHEQAGVRPALTVSPSTYNRKVGLGLFCPITRKIKGYPFEVLLPEDSPVEGVVLADQIRSLDWKARGAKFAVKAPVEVIRETQGKLTALIGPERP